MAPAVTKQTVIINVTRDEGWWIGIPQAAPGSGAGRTLTQLHDELTAIMPLMLDCQPGEFALEYDYTGLPEEIRAGLQRYHSLRDQREQVETNLRDTAREVALRLKAEKITDEDAGCLLGGLSRQRVGQLRKVG
jgi:hypothetical protein